MEDQPYHRVALSAGEFWGAVFASWLFFCGTGFLFLVLIPAQNLYGTWLFFLTPFIAGMVSGATANYKRETSGVGAWSVSFVSFLGGSFAMLLLAIEGLICLAMAFPIIFPIQVIGYLIGRGFISMAHERKRPFLFVTVPIFMLAMFDSAYQVPDPEMRTWTTTAVIDAPPEEIWPLLFELEDMAEPEFFLFKAGVGHLIEVRSEGQYVGAKRDCVLSTGVMPETISAVEPNRLLQFDVLSTPPPMKEVNPFGEVHAPHLEGYYSVSRGEIRLEPLPDGRTRVTGTSHYSFQIYPAVYWGLWTDLIAYQIHKRAFDEYSRRLESKAQ